MIELIESIPPWVWILLVVFAVIQGTVAYLILLERKIASWTQDRLGPNRVGPGGLLQPLADGLKFVLKEDYRAGGTDKVLFTIAPAIMITIVLVAVAVIPWGGWVQSTKTIKVAQVDLRSEPVSTSSPEMQMRALQEQHDAAVREAHRAIPYGSELVGPVLTVLDHPRMPDAPLPYQATYRYPFQIANLNIGVLFIIAVLSLSVYGDRYRRLGQQQQILLPRRPARHRPDDQLRDPPGPVAADDRADVRHAGPGPDRREAGPLLGRHHPGLERLRAAAGVHHVPDLPARRGQPHRRSTWPRPSRNWSGDTTPNTRSMRFALFFLAEYAGMIVTSAVCVALFFGGWHLPWIEWIWPALAGNVDHAAHPAITTSIIAAIVRCGGLLRQDPSLHDRHVHVGPLEPAAIPIRPAHDAGLARDDPDLAGALVLATALVIYAFIAGAAANDSFAPADIARRPHGRRPAGYERMYC